VKARSKVSMQVHTAIYGALAQAMPDKVQAGSGGFWAVHINGIDKEGKPVGAHILPWGGKGAVNGMDGHPTMPFPSNGTVTPTEIIENRVPLRIQYKRLLCDSSGPGKYRGGLGQEISFMCVSDYPIYVGVRPDKMNYPPPGINGGKAGAPGSFTVNGAQGSYTTAMPIVCQDGDEVVIRIPGAGGYGDPVERSPGAVARDVLLGFVSAERAREVYSVKLGSDGSVDDAATALLRRPAP
jgi:N-methylhydantoinase B